MNTETGWIKLYRSMAQWEWSDDPNTLSLFLHLLIMANREDGRWHGIVIKRGEVLTSLGKLAKLVGVSVQSIRTALTHLKSTQEITQFPHGNYTHISINNWESYQQTNTVANILPTARQQLANNKQEVKKIRSKEIDTFMSLFNSLFGGKYQPTAGRVAKFNLRLKAFTLDQILTATKNLSSSPWHQGKNDRGWKADPDFLLRSDEQIDKWLNQVPEPGKEAKPKMFIKLKGDYGQS